MCGVPLQTGEIIQVFLKKGGARIMHLLAVNKLSVFMVL